MKRRLQSTVVLNFLEVEEIIADRVESQTRLYLVKWKDINYKSWVTSDVVSALDALIDYFAKIIARIHYDHPNLSVEDKATTLFHQFSEASKTHVNKLVKQFLTISGLRLPLSRREHVLDEFVNLVRNRSIPSNETIKRLRYETLVEKILDSRRLQLRALSRMEHEINLINDSSEVVFLENNVDLEVLPDDFVYVNNYVPGKGVLIPNDPILGCDCSGAGGCKYNSEVGAGLNSFCCPDLSNTIPAYNEKKRLVLNNGQPIYECNKKCTCGPNCWNRVVQNKCKVKLSVFRTYNECGWGLRALEDIPEGTYVSRYVGEVITFEEAEKRNKEYLFDIDVNYAAETDLCAYTVDACKYGNVARFINHSCDPNLSVFAVLIDCLDPDLHELAFFAARDIVAGEELSFDYRKIMKCKCGSLKCKKKS